MDFWMLKDFWLYNWVNVFYAVLRVFLGRRGDATPAFA